jgi:proteasome lid subunit RPN8/RPN11
MTVASPVIAEMLAHAREEAPRECCGLLIGTRHAIERSVRARNVADRSTRYVVDPEDHFAAIHAARRDGREVVGAYHSHPSSAPVPSPTDHAEANSGTDFVYVIVSLLEDEVRAYRAENGILVPQPLEPAAEQPHHRRL